MVFYRVLFTVFRFSVMEELLLSPFTENQSA
ncbi:hypothetical protein A2U01_0082496, partial [Trifolium medium]|nr:hypothetical protein [Trifolium medium]